MRLFVFFTLEGCELHKSSNVRVRLVLAGSLLISQWRTCTASLSRTHTFLRSPISQWGERSKWLQNWGGNKNLVKFWWLCFSFRTSLQQLLNRTLCNRHCDCYAWSQIINLICSSNSSLVLSPVLLRNLGAPILIGNISVYVLRQRSPPKSCSHSSVECPHLVYKFHFTPLPHRQWF